MDSSPIEIIRQIIKLYNEKGVKWKQSSEKHFGRAHLDKRKRRKDLPENWSLEDYNKLIQNIINGDSNDIHLYYLETFSQRYIVFSDRVWIVIVGENTVMESCMPGNPSNYFSRNPGYFYLGKVKDVLK
ncbi:hypothetical protein QTG56_24805 (plasmid) [Rossellomorea sp. AcN35-11]|nr:hypothetical protein [Rossellomorea aquimaris]WJV31856.1 hypothetical protein QTG56_24805 [Rossellomorea sp. AcN35-11]